MIIPPLRREHDYLLKEISLIVPRENKKYDISAHLLQVTYEEDIFTGLTHGSILMRDVVDYPGLIPLIGEERIKLVLTRQDEEHIKNNTNSRELPPIEFEGQVYTMNDREIQSGSNKFQAYTLKFISDGFINNLKSRVNKSWSSTLYSDIVKDVYERYIKHNGKQIIVENTDFLQNYIATNKRPMEVISEISTKSVSSIESNGSFYVFYEDRDNYYYVTVSSLLEKEPIKKIRHEIRNITNENGEFDIARSINATVRYHQKKSFNLIDDLTNGKFSSRLLLVDPIRRKFEIKDFDLNSNWNKFKHTDLHKPFTDDPNSNKLLQSPEASISMIISDKDHDSVEHLISKDNSIKPQRLELAIQERDSQIQQIRRNIITALLPGDPRIKAGTTIEFIIPELKGKVSKEFPEELDKFISGKFLVVSCAHILEQGSYSVTIELVKDSFANAIFHRDPVKEYEDVF